MKQCIKLQKRIEKIEKVVTYVPTINTFTLNELKDSFSKTLKHQLLILGITQGQCATVVGVSRKEVNEWCAGKKLPSMYSYLLLRQNGIIDDYLERM